MTSIPHIRWIVLLSSLLLVLGCSSTSATEQAATAPAAPTLDEPGAAPETLASDLQQAALDPVYFDTDEADLHGEARRALQAHARAINAHPEWGVVTVEGHCDERGSHPYNERLGERRAAAVERFLVGQGVARARIETRSYGSRRPAVDGSGESAWRFNRRSELRLNRLAARL